MVERKDVVVRTIDQMTAEEIEAELIATREQLDAVKH